MDGWFTFQEVKLFFCHIELTFDDLTRDDSAQRDDRRLVQFRRGLWKMTSHFNNIHKWRHSIMTIQK